MSVACSKILILASLSSLILTIPSMVISGASLTLLIVKFNVLEITPPLPSDIK